VLRTVAEAGRFRNFVFEACELELCEDGFRVLEEAGLFMPALLGEVVCPDSFLASFNLPMLFSRDRLRGFFNGCSGRSSSEGATFCIWGHSACGGCALCDGAAGTTGTAATS